jgi:hypothetical protein
LSWQVIQSAHCDRTLSGAVERLGSFQSWVKNVRDAPQAMQLQSFTTFNLAILVLALGKWLTSKIVPLREFHIPEPVTSGLFVCLVATALHVFSHIQVGFNLATRDFS